MRHRRDDDRRAAQADREPLQNYDEALWRLVYLLCKADERMPDQGPLPPAAQVVADVFWMSDEKVRRDVQRYHRSIS